MSLATCTNVGGESEKRSGNTQPFVAGDNQRYLTQETAGMKRICGCRKVFRVQRGAAWDLLAAFPAVIMLYPGGISPARGSFRTGAAPRNLRLPTKAGTRALRRLSCGLVPRRGNRTRVLSHPGGNLRQEGARRALDQPATRRTGLFLGKLPGTAADEGGNIQVGVQILLTLTGGFVFWPVA